MGASQTVQSRGEKLKPESSKKEYKILLLGAGDSGYSEDQIQSFKGTIYFNILYMIKFLCIRCLKEEKFDSKENSEKAQRFLKIIGDDELNSLLLHSLKIYKEVHELVQDLWNDSKLQEIYKNHRNEYHIFDGADYIMGKLSDLDPSKYTPSFDDILRCKIKTTGLHTLKFKHEEVDFVIHDVGGHRSERKTWVNFFKDVDCLIFFTSLSEYDQLCYEDDSKNL